MSPDTTESDPSATAAPNAGTEPLACVSCRARKLKCDRTKPACSRCVKVSNECVYPESRRKPTFKRRNVKELEARLAQVEDYLNQVNKASEDRSPENAVPDQPGPSEISISPQDEYSQPVQNDVNTSEPQQEPFIFGNANPAHEDSGSFFTGTELLGLGMTESLPPDEVMEELNNIYFETHHYFIPIIHPGRYLQAFYSSPFMKPPLCLQYAIWAMASLGHTKYDKYHEVFYTRARQYLDADEMKGDGEHFITVNHAQAWGLIGSYESKRMLFTRSTISSARCARLCHMMGLDRIDGDSAGIPPSLAPPLSWAELEERRRVFWGAFCFDSHCSISTGWPSLINLEDISTRLPAPEEDFQAGRQVETAFLHEVWQGATYTGFAGLAVVCQIFKTILSHVQRSRPGDDPTDIIHGGFWKRQRELDNTLSSVFMFLPEKMRLPSNIRDPSAAHTNLNLHASVICLHHAAVEMVDKHGLAQSIKDTSLVRLKAAAEEIVNIVKLASHSMTVFKSPLCALSMYCATTVYIYQAKQDPAAGLNLIELGNLEIIVNAMEAIARTHKITRSFLQQACLDIERNGLSSSIRMPSLHKYRNAFGSTKPNIPLLCRSSVAKHTEISPILPGRLPLGRAGSYAMLDSEQTRGDGAQLEGKIVGTDCFKAVLGAVTRNVAVRDPVDPMNNKRKRMSPSPGPEMMAGLGGSGASANMPSFRNDATAIPLVSGLSGSAGSRVYTGNISLPDRTTSSSSSSPLNLGSGSRTTGSSHTSPDVGLGNTAEENRIDLRAFQGRVLAPLWPMTTEETTLFAEVNESMIQSLSADTGNNWGILDADIDWDVVNNMG